MKSDLALIKKHYGEKMMHLCATLFPTMLETDGLLFKIISSKFAYSKLLHDDIVKQCKQYDFQNYIGSFLERKKNIVESNSDPFYLMKKAGYTLYECKSEEDVQKFKKYYAPDEELCTFYSNRTEDHLVFFAVRNDADELDRDEFTNPKREDLYGTSVISIQFTKNKCNNLSIKNRYNHSVMKSDATFSNNLDNIIPGLTDSFRKCYNLNIFTNDYDFELDKYCCAQDGKYYKYNYHIKDTYYGANNIIIDIDKITEYEKEKYLIIDYFILDLVNKKIVLLDNLNDAFVNLPKINKIIITRESEGKKIIILMDNNYVNLHINKNNQIISYESNLSCIGDNFLMYNKTLTNFKDDKLVSVGNSFLTINNALTNIYLDNLEEVGDEFIPENIIINDFSFLKLRKVGSTFLRSCSIEKVFLPSLESVGSSFLSCNYLLSELNLPKLKVAGSFFISFNTSLSKLSLPSLEKVNHHFLYRNKKLTHVNLPNLKYIDDYFIYDNISIEKINIPKVLKIGDCFLHHNYRLKNLDIPSVLKIGDSFLERNRLLENINTPNLIYAGSYFLSSNDHLTELNMPKLLIVGKNFLSDSSSLTKISIPNLRECNDYFLSQAQNIDELNLGNNIKKYGSFFLGEYSKDNIYNFDKIEKKLVKRIKI